MDGSGRDIGFTLPGEYRPGAVLSHRESRLVLRATRIQGGSARILKCLVPPFPTEEEDAFRREFLLLDALRHPCWVRPHRFGSLPNGGYFLDMEEAAGCTLSRWPIRGWWPETLAVAHQVLSGLEVLHRLGYAHLDLGPEQLLVESTDTPTPWDAGRAGEATRVRLLDLGLAAPFGAEVGARGTPGSIAPELLQSRPGWDARADLYSVGTILFELFTGHPAFPGRTVRDVLTAQLDGPQPDPGNDVDLPPPVRDLVRELLARDPAARPRSALETWQRLREQAPRAGVGDLPPFLVAGNEFAFVGRDDEIAAFDAWLFALDPVTSQGQCEVAGEEGIGRRRLAARLGAVAESRGWERDGEADALLLRHPRGAEVRITVGLRADAPGGLQSQGAPSATTITAGPRVSAGPAVALDRTPSSVPAGRSETVGAILGDGDETVGAAPLGGEETVCVVPAVSVEMVPGGTTICIPVEPMSADTLTQALAAAGIESEVLRCRLAESCLGSPGLLAGLVGVLPREIDFAVRHTGEERLDATLDALPLATSWLGWLRGLLGRLAPADGTALLRAGAAGLPGMPEGVALGPVDLPASLDPAVRRGLLIAVDGRWRARSGAWARAIVGADNVLTAAIGRELLAGLERPGDDVARARLGLLLHDTDAVGAALPGALRSLGRLGRREEAVILHAQAAGLGSETLKGLAEEDILDLLEGAYGLGTPGGALLHEPTERSDGPGSAESAAEASGTASARALLDAWAWLGRRRPDQATIALQTAADLRPDSRTDDPRVMFLDGWLRFRLQQAMADAAGARRALQELRERVSPGDLRRQAWCDGAEAGILEQGRFEQALGLLKEAGPRLEALEVGEQATYLHMLSIIYYRLGDLRRSAEILERVEALWRDVGFTVNRLHAAGSLAGIAFQDGNLPLATAWREDLLREWTTRGSWDGAVGALVNLAQNLMERGRLGEAMRAVGDATALAGRTTAPLATRQVEGRRIHILACSGLVTRAEEEAERFFLKWETLAPGAAHFAHACLGDALFGLGRPDEGGAQFRRAAAGFLTSGATDDAAHALAHWGLAEMAAGRVAEARDRLAEIKPMRSEITGLTRSILALLEAEIALALPADRATADALQAAQLAVAAMEAQDRWFWAWRAHWCVARAHRSAGRAREGLASFETARTIVTGMVESLATTTRTDGFLRLPAMRSFLADLGQS